MSKTKKVKKVFFPSAMIASFYYSVLFGAGLICGYLATHFFQKNFLEKGKVRCLELKLGNWKIHFHHWLTGTLILLGIVISGWDGGWFQFFSRFWLGTLAGIVFHDLYLDSNWHKVVLRRTHSL